MKNKGFTLMELIVTISILALLAIVVVPIAIDSLEDSKEKSYVEQTKILERTAEKWSIKNAGLLSETSDYYLSIDTLVDGDYLNSSDIIDPRDQSVMNGCIVIHYNHDYSQYQFTYSENTCNQLSS